jgi:uncharacterized protein
MASLITETELARPVNPAYADALSDYSLKPRYSSIFFLTWDCNMSCNYCYEKKNRKKDSMSPEVARDGIDFFMGMAKKLHVQFFGGEPLLKFNLMKDMQSYLSKEYPGRYSFSIYTNGTLINDEVMDFFNKNNVYVVLSTDGPKEVHDRDRVFPDGSGTFDRIYPSLLRLDKNHSRIRMTVTPNNVDGLFENMMFFHDLGFNDIQEEVDRFVKWPEDKIDTLVGQYKKLEDFLVENYSKDQDFHWTNYERRIFPFVSPKNTNRSRCGSTESSCSLDVDGTLYPCQKFIVNQELSIGDIQNGFNEKNREIVSKFRLPDYLPETRGCRKCDYVGNCFSGCIADNIIQDTDQLQDCLFRRVHYQMQSGIYDKVGEIVKERRVKPVLTDSCGSESCGGETGCGSESGSCGAEGCGSESSCGGEEGHGCGSED